MFDESTINRTQVQLWYNRFKEGREEVIDDKNIEAWKKTVLDKHRITLREVPDDIGISFGFTDVLSMKHAAAKSAPKLPTKTKTTSHRHRSGDVSDVQRRSTLKPKPNHPSGSVQKS